MKPNNKTEFKPISELPNYSNKDEYFCSAVVFSPDTENEHFRGCPPYIQVTSMDGENDFYFEIPNIVAHYAKTHPCYTLKGKENDKKEGERRLAQKIKHLLDI